MKIDKKKKENIILVISSLIGIFIIGPFLMTVLLYHQTFGSRIETPARLRYENLEIYTPRTTHFYSGRNRLTGYIYGEDNDKGLVVISHGLGAGAEHFFFETMFFVENGWRVFAFNKTGTLSSDGRGARGLPQSVIDLNAALEYIADQNWNLPIMLYGHSWGGYAVTAVLNKGHDINAVFSSAAFESPMGMLHEHTNNLLGRFGSFTHPYLWLYQRILFGENANLSAIQGINSTSIPVMIIHGTDDEIISYSGASIMAQRENINNPNVQFITHYQSHHNRHNNLFDINLLNTVNDFFYSAR